MYSPSTKQVQIQQQYYAETSEIYENLYNADKKDGHYFALSVLIGLLDFLEIKSILDIGSGTGRAIHFIKAKRPKIQIVDVKPIKELRQIGHSFGKWQIS